MKLWFGIGLLCLLGLTGCETAPDAHAVYHKPPICTDMRPFEPIDKPPDEQPQPTCSVRNPGGEMYAREKGLVGIPEGIGIVATEAFYGLTGAQ